MKYLKFLPSGIRFDISELAKASLKEDDRDPYKPLRDELISRFEITDQGILFRCKHPESALTLLKNATWREVHDLAELAAGEMVQSLLEDATEKDKEQVSHTFDEAPHYVKSAVVTRSKVKKTKKTENDGNDETTA